METVPKHVLRDIGTCVRAQKCYFHLTSPAASLVPDFESCRRNRKKINKKTSTSTRLQGIFRDREVDPRPKFQFHGVWATHETGEAGSSVPRGFPAIGFKT